jgi:hypothetical protein
LLAVEKNLLLGGHVGGGGGGGGWREPWRKGGVMVVVGGSDGEVGAAGEVFSLVVVVRMLRWSLVVPSREIFVTSLVAGEREKVKSMGASYLSGVL